jgi:hypothetical protein
LTTYSFYQRKFVGFREAGLPPQIEVLLYLISCREKPHICLFMAHHRDAHAHDTGNDNFAYAPISTAQITSPTYRTSTPMENLSSSARATLYQRSLITPEPRFQGLSGTTNEIRQRQIQQQSIQRQFIGGRNSRGGRLGRGPLQVPTSPATVSLIVHCYLYWYLASGKPDRLEKLSMERSRFKERHTNLPGHK